MRLVLCVAASLGALLFAAGDGRAQMQLPGATLTPPLAPPSSTQNPRPPGPQPGLPQAGDAAPRPPPPRRPEETLTGRNLRFLGQQGSLMIVRTGQPNRPVFTIAITGVGRRGDDIRNVCTPSFNAGAVVTLTANGRPAGLPRYEAGFPGCRVYLDLLPDAVLVSAPDGACRFANDCVVEPAGLWGPTDRELPAEREMERARGAADRRLNDARRRLQQRLRNSAEGRAFIQDQVAFPANRERLCRNYGTTDAALGFCALKYTEARAAELEARLARGGRGDDVAEEPQPRRQPTQR